VQEGIRITLYEDNAGHLTIHRDGDRDVLWGIEEAAHMNGALFLDDAPTFAEWVDGYNGRVEPLSSLDHTEIRVIALYTESDGVQVQWSDDGQPVAGHAGREYLGL